jgi:putative membrane protein
LLPLSPAVRAGRALFAIVVVLLPGLLAGRDRPDAVIQLGIVGVLGLVGFVSWLVTRWRIEGDALRIETGLIRRSSLRFPLSQVQAIDVLRPGLARIFGLAEVRLRMGGATGHSGRLAYLPDREAERLRERLLELAGGTQAGEHAVADERVLASVPVPRLIGSILLSSEALLAAIVLAAVLVALVEAPRTAVEGLSGGAGASALAFATVLWRRFNQEYNQTVAEARDGLRLRGGLIALSAETLRPGRVQAVRMVEPLVWRAFGWCRLEVDVAGRQRTKGEGRAQSRQLRALLPVGSRATALELVERILPDVPHAHRPPPRRALLKSPLRWHYLGWGRTERCVVTTGGRLTRVTAWVPLEKVQSLRFVEGPVQRRLHLASVHLDTAGRNVHAELRDRDTHEAVTALRELIDLSRSARYRRSSDTTTSSPSIRTS